MSENVDDLLEQGCALFDKGFYLKDKEDIQSMVKSFELFVEANKLIDSIEEYSILKPKVLGFIALCNFKMGNMDSAYKIARKGKLLVLEVLNNCPFTGFSGAQIGEKKLDELIYNIEHKYFNQVDKENLDAPINENIINLKNVKSILDDSLPSIIPKKELKMIIELISKYQKNYSEIEGDQAEEMNAFEIIEGLDMYKNPLLFAWEKYKYGWHSDFWEEGESMFEYMDFEMNINEILQILVSSLKNDSPFKMVDEDFNLTQSLLRIYTSLQEMLRNGEIKP